VDDRSGGVLPNVPPDRFDPVEPKENTMKGYVARRRGRFYAVIYEGLDPITGRERRRWHPAGVDRVAAERLAARLATEEQGRSDAVRALTFGAYLTAQWLPAKKLQLAASTYRGYERNVQRHILPTLGRVGLRRLRHHHIEALYDQLLNPSLKRPALAPKTVYEIHLVIRGCLADAVRRGLLARNVALLAHSPRLKAIPKTEAQSWTDDQLRQFLRTAAGHRLFPAPVGRRDDRDEA
jgi:integrase